MKLPEKITQQLTPEDVETIELTKVEKNQFAGGYGQEVLFLDADNITSVIDVSKRALDKRGYPYRAYKRQSKNIVTLQFYNGVKVVIRLTDTGSVKLRDLMNSDFKRTNAACNVPAVVSDEVKPVEPVAANDYTTKFERTLSDQMQLSVMRIAHVPFNRIKSITTLCIDEEATYDKDVSMDLFLEMVSYMCDVVPTYKNAGGNVQYVYRTHTVIISIQTTPDPVTFTVSYDNLTVGDILNVRQVLMPNESVKFSDYDVTQVIVSRDVLGLSSMSDDELSLIGCMSVNNRSDDNYKSLTVIVCGDKAGVYYATAFGNHFYVFNVVGSKLIPSTISKPVSVLTKMCVPCPKKLLSGELDVFSKWFYENVYDTGMLDILYLGFTNMSAAERDHLKKI